MTRTLLAPAKINLCLHVLRKRTDGYHDLAMLMQRISLYDRIELTLNASGAVRVRCDGVALAAGEENIAARAARRVLELTGSRQGVEIVIDRQIPVAAGLGGGSSDAASVLLGLNDMLGAGLTQPQLMAEGAKLGADVPFFLFAAPAWATGIGDVLRTVPPLPEVCYVLVNPGVAVSTAAVYQNLRLTSPDEVTKLPGFPSTVPELAAFLHNDLEQVTIGRHPQLAAIKTRLCDLGAAGALMSGSGPTLFGVFASAKVAEAARKVLATESSWRVFLVRPL